MHCCRNARMWDSRTQVLIVGGGPIGLALAAELGWRGVKTQLVEQNTMKIGPAKMLLVGTRTMEFCRHLGMAEQVRDWGFPPDFCMDNVFVAGSTQSSDFPTVNPLSEGSYSGAVLHGSQDAFVFRLNSSGSTLGYSTYLGGAGGDTARGLAVDGSGNLYLAGSTDSTDFPTANAFQTSSGGGTDVFVSKISSSGSLSYSSYLGGADDDDAFDLALSGSTAYVVGSTASPGLRKSPRRSTLVTRRSDRWLTAWAFWSSGSLGAFA